MKFRDSIVAGSAGDFLQARHLVFQGTQREVGRALARIATSELGTDKEIPWTDPSTTAKQLEWLRTNWPAHYERSLGVADALGLRDGDHRIDPTSLYYYWAAPGCSNVFWPGTATSDGHAMLMRNYDFTTGTVFELMGKPVPPEAANATAAPFLVETHPSRAAEGFATLCIASYELLGGATDGINSEGLSVALMATVDVMRGTHNTATFMNGVGVNEIQLVRFVLENAATAQEARELLARTPQYTMWVPCHFLVADAGGDSFVYSRDVSPAAPVVQNSEGARPLCATNHIPGHQVVDVPQRRESVERLARLASAVDAAGAGAERDVIRAAAESVAATLPVGEGQYASTSPARTLWHAMYDLEARTLDVDFYLGESANGIRRSQRTLLHLSGERVALQSLSTATGR